MCFINLFESERLIVEAQGLTIFDLEQGSNLVLPASQLKTEPNNYRFENTRINYMKGVKSLEYLTQTFNKDTKMHYNTNIVFYGVEDPYTEPPELDKNPVRVSCSCPAYYYYFWYANKQAKAHSRGNLRPYIRKTPPPPAGLPYKNPDKIPGLCKHLIAFSNYLNLGDYFLGDKRKFNKV